MVRRAPKVRARGTTKTATPKYHTRIDFNLEDLQWIASDQRELDDTYRDPRSKGYAPVPEQLSKVPYGTRLTTAELHEAIDEIAAWAQASGLTNVLFNLDDYCSFMAFKPFTPAEREAAKKAEAKKAIIASKRRESAARRKKERDAAEEEKQRNLLRVLAKKYPEEVRAVNKFED